MRKNNFISRGVKDAEAAVPVLPEFANLTYDPGFKIVLGTEGRSERLLMLLLNHVLGMKIVSVKYLPTERLGLTEEESRSFFDVYCKDSYGRRFLIEMQMWSQNYYHKRAVYYSSLSIQDQARVEKKVQKDQGRPWDYYFAPVYQISFLNFPNTIVETKYDGENQYISHYVYKSKDTGRELGDETNIIFIDLAKFRKNFEECETQGEKWLYSIRNMHLLKQRPAGIEGTELDELFTEAHLAAWPAEKRLLYEKHIMNRNDYENILYERYEEGFDRGYSDGHQQGLNAGCEKGLKEGLKEGREEGREEGRKEGRKEGMAAAITTMLSAGISVEVIAKAFGMTEEQCAQYMKK